MTTGEKVAIAISVCSLVVSVGSVWEADRQRQSSERSEAAASQAAKDNRHLTELISRPWVTLSGVALRGGSNASTGVEFRFKNGGPIAALDLKVIPGITWDDHENVTDDLIQAENNSSMAVGTVPAGEFRSVIMPADLAPGLRTAIRSVHTVRFGIRWRYADADGKKHTCQQFGHWDKHSQMFAMDNGHIE